MKPIEIVDSLFLKMERKMNTMETILVNYEGHVATITINRPKALNALSTQVLTELNQHWMKLRQTTMYMHWYLPEQERNPLLQVQISLK